jgi:hypothetical protein
MTGVVPVAPGDDLQTQLDAWVAHGLIDARQAARIHRFEHPSEPVAAAPPADYPEGQRGLAVEAIAYAGGAIALAGLSLLVGLSWRDLTLGARLALPGAATLALLAVGLFVGAGNPGAPPLRRLRAAAWLAATGTCAAFLGVLGAQALDLEPRRTWLLVWMGTAALAAALYVANRSLVQHLALLVAFTGVGGAVGGQAGWDQPTMVGLGVTVAGLLWLGAGERRLLLPPGVSRYGAAIALVTGAMLMTQAVLGIVLAVAVLGLLFVLGVRTSSIGLLVIAALGTLQVVPEATSSFVPDRSERVFVPLSLLGTGAVFVVAALVVMRRRQRRLAPTSAPERSA